MSSKFGGLEEGSRTDVDASLCPPGIATSTALSLSVARWERMSWQMVRHGVSRAKMPKTSHNHQSTHLEQLARSPAKKGGMPGALRLGKNAKEMRQPRIERGAHRWQRWILPLNH